MRARLYVPVHQSAAVKALHRGQHAFRELEEVVSADAALLHQCDEVRPEELRVQARKALFSGYDMFFSASPRQGKRLAACSSGVGCPLLHCSTACSI